MHLETKKLKRKKPKNCETEKQDPDEENNKQNEEEDERAGGRRGTQKNADRIFREKDNTKQKELQQLHFAAKLLALIEESKKNRREIKRNQDLLRGRLQSQSQSQCSWNSSSAVFLQ